MSGLVGIKIGMCRCCYWLLRDMWLWHLRDMSGLCRKCISRRIWCLWRSHEWMWYNEEPIDVVGHTLTWHNTYVTCWCKMVWVVRPPIVYDIKWHPLIDRVCKNTLDVSELTHNPLRSVSDSNRPPMELSWKTWNKMKLLDRSVLPIWHPANIWNPETIQAACTSL